MGFFLHIPFPAPEIFRALPENDVIGRALCAYDVIGLQTENDVRNFKHFLAEDFRGKAINDEQVEIDGHILTIRHCPIGMNAPEFVQTAQSEIANDAAQKLNRFLGERQLIIGVDRMDYSKGLPQRFEAVGRLFDTYPETHGAVSFTQIAPPSRSIVDEYAHLRETLDQLSGRINGDYGDLDWIPIRYLARSYNREEIAGLYRMANVCLVTPLQDGMNLEALDMRAKDISNLSLKANMALFLDFDGTLAPLCDDAASVSISEEQADLLVDVSKVLGGALAIISGRDLRDLAPRIPNELWRSGNHGLFVAPPGSVIPTASIKFSRASLTINDNMVI